MQSEIEEYLEYYRHRVGERTHFRVSYQLRQVVREMLEARWQSWEEITSVDWISYFNGKRQAGWKDGSVRQVQWEVKGLYRYLQRENKVAENPICWDIKRVEWTPKHVPSQEVMEQILDGDFMTHHPLRDCAICELIYSCGLRAREVVRLKVRDVDVKELRIVGKGNRERIVPMGHRAYERLQHYIAGERDRMVCRHNPLEDALFVTRDGHRMGYGALCYMLKKRVGNHPITLHTLRHACASHLLEGGMGVTHVQRILGHRKLSSTEVYTRVKPSGLREMLGMYHLRG